MTRTCVAQVVSLGCAPHISSVISMRSCCVFDSLRLLHLPLLAVYLLSYRLVFLPGHQLHLPRCGGQIPCALQLMRSLAPLPSTTLSQFQTERSKLERLGAQTKATTDVLATATFGTMEALVGGSSAPRIGDGATDIPVEKNLKKKKKTQKKKREPLK